VLRLRSKSNIVIPPARTGSLKTNKKAVTHTLTKNNGILNHLKDGTFKLFIVQRKFTDPAIELTPAK
jgi:rRNA processing protein Krr1/Pno1